MAAPYIGGKLPLSPPTIMELTRNLLAQGCEEFQLITTPPSAPRPRGDGQSDPIGIRNLQIPEADIMSGMDGFDLMIHKDRNLHSKVYQFVFPEGDRAAFVGSANLTLGGLKNNPESVAFFLEKEDNYAMADKINWLAACCAAGGELDRVAVRANNSVVVELDRLAARALPYLQWKTDNSKEKK